MKSVQEHKYYNNPLPYKSMAALDLKADKESRKVSFYAAAFGNIDSDGDVLVRGAFAKSIQEHGPQSNSQQKIAYLFQHDMKNPIGRIIRMEEDEKGLYVEAEIDNISEGDRVLTQYQSGTLNQHSIGFRYIWDKVEYDETTEAFIVKEVQLWEVSVVTLGANENTPFMGMKSEEIARVNEELQQEINTFCKSLDPTIAYKARQLMAKCKALATSEPDMKSTLKDQPTKTEQPQFDLGKVANFLK